MRFRRLAFPLLAGIVATWWWQRPPPEPVYEGQRLSEWLDSVTGPDVATYNRFERLQAFGPGTVPWLAYTAEHGRDAFERHGLLFFDNAPEWLRRRVPERWGGLQVPSSKYGRSRALWGLDLLGSKAAPAIPALTRLLERECENDETDVALTVAQTLHNIGPASWPAVQRIMEHGKPRARRYLLGSIELRLFSLDEATLKAEAGNVVPMLVKACTDPNTFVRQGAVWGLGNCWRTRYQLISLDQTIPVVIPLLYDSDGAVRERAAAALSECGFKAAVVIPRLIELLDDQESDVRRSAAMALGKVDFEEKRSAVRLRIIFSKDPDDLCRQFAGDALTKLGLPGGR